MYRLKKSYYEDIRYFDENYKRVLAWMALGALLVFPYIVGSYFLYIIDLIFVYVVITLGLNILMGNCGQISLGHAAFVAIGAYVTAIMQTSFSDLPFLLVIMTAGLIAAAAGLIVGLPALRLKFLYLALATMAFELVVEEIIVKWRAVTHGQDGMPVPKAQIFGFLFDNETKVYYLIGSTTVLMVLLAKNIARTNIGRAFAAIRDSDIAAQVMGINVGGYKLLAFCIAGFYAGVGGSLYAFLMRYIGPENFSIHESIAYLVVILVGGLGSIMGSIAGAVFLTLLPEAIRLAKDVLPLLGEEKNLHTMIYGLVLILFVLFEPHGLHGRWIRVKTYFELFPLGKKPKRKQVVVSGARRL
jgi:branched-chain amino acid transport system permease protein